MQLLPVHVNLVRLDVPGAFWVLPHICRPKLANPAQNASPSLGTPPAYLARHTELCAKSMRAQAAPADNKPAQTRQGVSMYMLRAPTQAASFTDIRATLLAASSATAARTRRTCGQGNENAGRS